MKTCKDCVTEGVTSQREAKFPGPRCFTHHKAFKKAAKQRSHDAAVSRTYGLAPGDYERLYESQGRRCAIAGCRATGKSKRLAVDHDHRTGEVRGLLCTPHNRVIGYNFDSPEAFDSLAEYLRNPPARAVLDPKGNVQVLSNEAKE